ncbi:HDOD domain-containing protein [Desulfocurvus vexinensis]|uniref:HDOD domain-containing protein n=1 Tax=Desulfocurvus vexinensis TaxID=399548 RepID=UPI0004AD2E05|nr:HDOD domain-containing protein [Desulfocurvus vexinensis]
MYQIDTRAADFPEAESYVRGFFLYVDPDHEAMVALYRVTVARTLAALRAGWTFPTIDQLMPRNVEHLRDMFYQEQQGGPREIVDAETKIASFPDVYFRLREELDRPTSSADDVARVVGTDVALTAKLLKLVNSPLYGFAERIDSVPHAVSLLGVKEVSNLALGISTINFFKDIPPELMDMRTFWKHSISVGIFSKLLASRVRGAGVERLFTAGLLHDVGRLILFKKLPYASTQALLHARSNMLPVVDAEGEVFGYDHTEVGQTLLAAWNFPPEMTALVRHHHSPMEAPSPLDAAVVQVADNMANAAEIPAGGKFVLPGVSPGAWELLKLSPETIEPLMELYDLHIEEVLETFL